LRKHVEQTAQLGERAAAGVGNSPHRAFGEFWVGPDRVGRSVGLDDHDAHRVRHDVVQLPRDAAAFVVDGDLGGLVAFGLQQVQPGLHFDVVRAPRADELAEHPAQGSPSAMTIALSTISFSGPRTTWIPVSTTSTSRNPSPLRRPE